MRHLGALARRGHFGLWVRRCLRWGSGSGGCLPGASGSGCDLWCPGCPELLDIWVELFFGVPSAAVRDCRWVLSLPEILVLLLGPAASAGLGPFPCRPRPSVRPASSSRWGNVVTQANEVEVRYYKHDMFMLT